MVVFGFLSLSLPVSAPVACSLESSLLEDPLKPRAAYPPEYHLAVERLYALCGEGAAAESQSPLRPRRRRHLTINQRR